MREHRNDHWSTHHVLLISLEKKLRETLCLQELTDSYDNAFQSKKEELSKRKRLKSPSNYRYESNDAQKSQSYIHADAATHQSLTLD